MPENNTFSTRPSLLVGVGGTGLRIARRIQEKLHATSGQQSMKVAILAFDTDEGDIKKAKKGSTRFPIIQVSSQEQVYQILQKISAGNSSLNYPSVEEIPYDLLIRKNIDGAGQVRMLSAMGLYYEMLQGHAVLNGLRSIQTDLFAAIGHPDAAEYEGSLDVMIVGSIAGGTGSGIFLQIALIIRDWLASIKVAATVRGCLLLPNVFINGGLPVQQNNNVKINAHAALREIHAVMQAVTGRTDSSFEFQYAPQKKMKVWQTGESPQDRPFHSLVLMDGFAHGGRALNGGIPAYERMAAECAFQLLYTPLGAKQNSIHDNNVRDSLAQAASSKTTCYAGMGMAGLVYPLQEVEHYLCLRFAQQTLSGEWLKLDDMYKAALSAYEERKRRGDPNASKAPERGRHFIESLKTFASERQYFFTDIHSEVYLKVEDAQGNISVTETHKEYLDALETHLMNQFWADRELARLSRSGFQVLNLDEVDNDGLLTAIREKERMVSRIRTALDNRIINEPRNTFQSIWIIAETSDVNSWMPYHIQTYLFAGNAHPVKARYFLYSLFYLMQERLEKAKKDLAGNSSLLDSLGALFDDKDTRNVIETAIDQARDLEDLSAMQRILGRDHKAFKAKYSAYFRDYSNALKNKGQIKGTIQIYQLLNTQVEKLIRTLEQFFDSLQSLEDSLKTQVQSNANKHAVNAPANDTSIYVLADKQAKQALWQDLAPSLTGESVGKEINASLLKGIYQAYQVAGKPRHSRFDESPTVFDGSQLFKEKVVDGYCQEQLQTRYMQNYQFNIAQAIEKDALMRGKPKDEHLKSLAQSIINQSQPFLDTEAGINNDIYLWSLSPTVHKALGGDAGVTRHLSEGMGSVGFMVEPAFDDQRLNCFNFRLNLSVEDLSLFKKGGMYQAAYKKAHDLLLKEEHDKGKTPSVFTYHIHKDWHRPGVLPEFSSEEQKQLTASVLQAYVVGHALNLFIERTVIDEAHTFVDDRLLAKSTQPDLIINTLTRKPTVVDYISNKEKVNLDNSALREELTLQLVESDLLFRIVQLWLYRDSQNLAEPALQHYFLLLKAVIQKNNPGWSEAQRYEEFNDYLNSCFSGLKDVEKFKGIDVGDQAALKNLFAKIRKSFGDSERIEIENMQEEGTR